MEKLKWKACWGGGGSFSYPTKLRFENFKNLFRILNLIFSKLQQIFNDMLTVDTAKETEFVFVTPTSCVLSSIPYFMSVCCFLAILQACFEYSLHHTEKDSIIFSGPNQGSNFFPQRHKKPTARYYS